MLLDPATLDLAHGIEAVLADVPDEHAGQVKPELFQSVLEVATTPCPDIATATEQLAGLRRLVGSIARRNGMLVGAAGTHPFARCDDQRIVDRPRYRELAADLGFIAERELIFGTHVHIGIDSADKAIYVADGIRRHLPLLLALSSNSPFWEGRDTGMMSARTPVFRAFPRQGVPPHYGSWEIYARRVGQMTGSGAIEDYTYLWWDVRPHPNLGTVETRVFDQATRIEDTAAYAALTLALSHRFAELFDEGELVDFARGRPVAATEMAKALIAEVEANAAAVGCAGELRRVAEIVAAGTGARRQLDFCAAHGDDLRELVAAAVALTAR
ncbi:MAG: YbdK family carboxylate-amine ligase [Acidobacteria bacterium]|nr:MAG: YbdK family carboxylate-amine ligase [Acidobacteriota bacterium]